MSSTTKKAIGASLKKLLLQKPFHKITINDIAEDCEINRMTFYYHFKDIYDLAQWVCAEEAQRVLENNNTYDTWQQGFLNIFDAVLENKPLVMNIYHSVSHEQIYRYLNQMVYGLLIRVVEEKSAGMAVRQEDQQFIANFYKYAFTGIMLDWIKNGMKETPEQIVEQLSILIHGNITRGLNNFRTDLPSKDSK